MGDLVSNEQLPLDVLDPSSIKNESGALGLYRGTLNQFSFAYSANQSQEPSYDGRSFVRLTGLLTDELTKIKKPLESFPNNSSDYVDARLLSGANATDDFLYNAFHLIRANSRQARMFLRKYSTTLSTDLVAHLFTIEGIAELVLADLYCSGIPLSTVDFEENFTLTRGFRTEEVYQHALSLFDSADSYIRDSVQIRQLTVLSRARVLLALGRIAEARDAVVGIPTDFTYHLVYSSVAKKYLPDGVVVDRISDLEGANGLPFRTANDPRLSMPALHDFAAPFTLATGIDARLMEAEASLVTGEESWLSKLNQLRTTCTETATCPTPAPPGEAGVANLPPLTDPSPGASMSDTAARSARLDLIFSERAYWLFLTGRRQGDLRRLIRTYHRKPYTVYPIGPYLAAVYGSDVNLPVPMSERSLNPKYKGCFDRDA